MWACPCGVKSPRGFSFCPQCGTEQPKNKVWGCSCGAVNLITNNCGACGLHYGSELDTSVKHDNNDPLVRAMWALARATQTLVKQGKERNNMLRAHNRRLGDGR